VLKALELTAAQQVGNLRWCLTGRVKKRPTHLTPVAGTVHHPAQEEVPWL